MPKANPYDPNYIMKRDGVSHEEAMAAIAEYKRMKATTLANFVSRYGQVEGTKRYNDWKENSRKQGKCSITIEELKNESQEN
jgi:hypothetical protein